MAKHKDITGMGKSTLCPKRKDELESSSDRHFRRKIFNEKQFSVVEEFCQNRGLRFRLLNCKHHWQVSRENTMVEWWPSSAKVIINKNWGRGVHCHDYEQFIGILKKQFKGKTCAPNS